MSKIILPTGWARKTIGEIATVSSGGTPSRKKVIYWNGSIPWVTTAEVDFGIIVDSVQKITDEGLNNSSAKLFPIDTILMAMYGQGKTRGKVAKLGIEAATNQACAAIILKKECNLDFYFQYLKSQYKNIRDLSNSGGQENLSGGIVKSIQVPIPPLPEQRKIAQILSTWDKAISATEALITNSQQQKKALMQQLLTGKKRFAGFEGEWEELALGKIAEYQKGYTYKSSEYSEEKTNQGFLTLKSIQRGGGYSSTGIKYLVSIVDDKFLYYILKLPCYRNFMRARASGSTVLHLDIQGSKKLKLLCPTSASEQQKIASVLSSADQEIDTLQQKLTHLKQEKKALMQQLLTGKRRVKL